MKHCYHTEGQYIVIQSQNVTKGALLSCNETKSLCLPFHLAQCFTWFQQIMLYNVYSHRGLANGEWQWMRTIGNTFSPARSADQVEIWLRPLNWKRNQSCANLYLRSRINWMDFWWELLIFCGENCNTRSLGNPRRRFASLLFFRIVAFGVAFTLHTWERKHCWGNV